MAMCRDTSGGAYSYLDLKGNVYVPGAVENSVVAYKDHLIVGNNYGYVDPFMENPTAGGIVKKKTLGKKDYGKKVFNNIWGTFSFGPRNSIFIGTYRG